MVHWQEPARSENSIATPCGPCRLKPGTWTWGNEPFFCGLIKKYVFFWCSESSQTIAHMSYRASGVSVRDRFGDTSSLPIRSRRFEMHPIRTLGCRFTNEPNLRIFGPQRRAVREIRKLIPSQWVEASSSSLSGFQLFRV